MRDRPVSLAIGLLCLSALDVQSKTIAAQDRVVVHGSVVDSAAVPVRDATVRGRESRFAATTDSAGKFTLPLDRGGTWTIIVAKVGFRPESVTVTFGGRVGVDTIFVLRNAVTVLPVVEIESDVPEQYRGIARYEDFYERRRSAIGGTFFDRAQLARLGSTAWALNTVPGVRATEFSGRVIAQFSRCPSGKIAVIIDGVYMPSLGMGDIRSNEVETMEVYTGVAQIPPVARGDACAAIILTTRMTAAPRDSSSR